MAFVDKGSIATTLSIAFATENPVKGKLTTRTVAISFTTDLADGAEGSILLTQDASDSCKDIAWPATVKWQGGNKPHPNYGPNSISHFKFIRDAAVGYIGRLVTTAV